MGTRGKQAKPLMRDHFFVLGTGRNGSTLLARLLNDHASVFVPPEQYALPKAIVRWQFYRHLDQKAIVESIVAQFEVEKNTLWSVDFNGLREKLNRLSSDQFSFEHIYDAIVMHYAEQVAPTATRWGAKSPNNTLFYSSIQPLFPGARYIMLKRDVRDVMVSGLGLEGNPIQDPDYAVWKWMDSYRIYKRHEDHEEMLLLTYEELVTNPDLTLKKVYTHIGISDQVVAERNVNSAAKMNVSNLSFHQNLDKPINTSSVGKWKGKITDAQLAAITPECKDAMRSLGYDID